MPSRPKEDTFGRGGVIDDVLLTNRDDDDDMVPSARGMPGRLSSAAGKYRS